MDYKKTNAEISTITYDRELIEKQTGNIYEAIAVMAKRSEQINANLKKEIVEKLEDFSISNDNNLQEVFENKEQIEVSTFYEKLPKPHAIAVQEWLDGDIYYKQKEEDSDTAE